MRFFAAGSVITLIYWVYGVFSEALSVFSRKMPSVRLNLKKGSIARHNLDFILKNLAFILKNGDKSIFYPRKFFTKIKFIDFSLNFFPYLHFPALSRNTAFAFTTYLSAE